MVIKPLKKIIIFIFTISILMIFMLSYIIISETRCLYGTNDIRVNELIIVIAQEKGINYCDMLRKSFKDNDDFSKFISLKFYDGSGIDHSDVVYQLYQYYGSKKFWEKAILLSDDDKKLVQNYLDYAISENEAYADDN